jgi:peroxiredoxin
MKRAFLLLAAVLLLASCATDKNARPSSEFELVSPGGKTDITYTGDDRKPIANLAGESLVEDGKQVALADYRNQVVVINFWGAWCPPCRVEAPQLQQLYDKTRASGVTVLGIDLRDNDKSFPQDFVRDQKITYPSIYDPAARSLLSLKGYPRNTVPSTIILDRRHRVAAVYLRSVLASDVMALVQQLAKEK